MRTVPIDAMKRTRGGLLAIDAVILSYIAIVCAVILIRFPAIPRAGLLLAVHLAVGAALLMTARVTRRSAVERALLVRVVFCCVSIPILFLLLGGIVKHANPFHAEIALKRIDDLLFFGHNPNVLLDRIQTPVLTEYLQIIYATYYFIPLVLFFALLKRRDYEGIEKCTMAVVSCLLLSYLGYFMVPATAPCLDIHDLYPWPSYEEEIRSGNSSLPGIAMADPIRRVLHYAETIRHDCFPSGHTAMSLVVLLLARRLHRGAYRALFVPVVSLIFSTMYLRYHYVIDVIAGVGLAILILKACPKLEHAFKEVFIEPTIDTKAP